MHMLPTSDDDIDRLFDMTPEQLSHLIDETPPDRAAYHYMDHRTHWLTQLSESFFAWLSRHAHRQLIAAAFQLINYKEDRTTLLTHHANERIASKAVSPSQWLKKKARYRLPYQVQRGIVLGSPYQGLTAPILLPHFRTTVAIWPDITSDVIAKIRQEHIAV